jgi:hypothetical protein
MKIVNSKFFKGALLSIFLAVCNFANAGIIYTYSGNNFDAIGGSITTADSVLIQITLDEALDANLINVDVTGFSGFGVTMSTAGVTYTDVDIFTNHSGPFIDALVTAEFTTDSLGNITAWDVRLKQTFTNDISILDMRSLIGATFSTEVYYYSYYEGFDKFEDYGYASVRSPNKWSSRDAVQVVEPSNIAIFALGMFGLASRRFKKQS